MKLIAKKLGLMLATFAMVFGLAPQAPLPQSLALLPDIRCIGLIVNDCNKMDCSAEASASRTNLISSEQDQSASDSQSNSVSDEDSFSFPGTLTDSDVFTQTNEASIAQDAAISSSIEDSGSNTATASSSCPVGYSPVE